MPSRNTRPHRLKPRHQKFLDQRAVSAIFAEARGYWTLEAAAEFRSAGWGETKASAVPKWLRPPGLVIPIHSLLSLELGEEEEIYSQYRPDRPARDQEGRVRKYVNPTGSKAVLDVNPAGYGGPLWKDRDTPLFIVEGVPKGDACWSAGIPAVSIQGVWNFTSQDEHEFREMIPDMRYLPVAGREVVIAFDADTWTNPAVRAAARELGRVLSSGKGGASKISALRLPSPEKKQGIDDYLAEGHSAEDVFELLVDLEELAQERGAQLRCLGDIKAEPPECLWEPYLLKDTLCFLDGAPGVGKTWIALNLCAAITRGRTLPMGWAHEEDLGSAEIPKGTVVYLTQENSPSRSIRPRFDRLKGDASKFYVREAMEGDDETFFTLQDLGPLRAMIKEVNPLLVVLDPIMNFIGERTDAHRDNEVRPMLSRLMTLAEQTGTTILGVRHLRKAATGSAVYAAGGSVAFSGTARSVLMASKYFKEGHGDTTVLAHAKTSDTPVGMSLEYSIKDLGKDAAGFYQADFEWGGRSEISADELVGDKASGKRPKSEVAESLLSRVLNPNPDGVAVSIIMTAAEQMGLGEKTLRAAAKELGVVKEKSADKDGHWLWKIPGAGVRRTLPNTTDSQKY